MQWSLSQLGTLKNNAGIVRVEQWNRADRIRKPLRKHWWKWFARLRSLPLRSGAPEKSSSRRAARPAPELSSLGTTQGEHSSTWLGRRFLRSAGLSRNRPAFAKRYSVICAVQVQEAL